MTMRPLILVHGTRMHGGQWRQYPALLPDVAITMVDFPGHGPRAAETFTKEAALATITDAVAACHAAGDHPPVLAGHSLGGYLSLLWAARHSSELAGLVLIGATAAPQSVFALPYRAFSWLTTRADPVRLAGRMNRVAQRLGVDADHLESIADGSGYAALPAAWKLVMDEVSPELLRDVRCPVRLVNGQYDQMRLHVARFAAQAHRVSVITVPGATHLLPLTHPGVVAEVLRDAVSDPA